MGVATYDDSGEISPVREASVPYYSRMEGKSPATVLPSVTRAVSS